ncbi:hypothetical protein FOCC_FOCC008304 [Frankliniella occidentalis]|nr:hypothetical protein FOCC_FOCC008304 [Frankliniella occidentalis]
MDDDGVVAVMAAVVVVLDEEEAELDALLLAMARIAVADIFMEEGVLYNEELWKKISVDFNEYHDIGDPCFGLHFRMTRAVFERLTDAVFVLEREGKVKRKRTPYRDTMVMVVWRMATADSFRSVALRFGRRPSTYLLLLHLHH